MSFFAKFLSAGGRNKNKAPTAHEAIQKLRETEEMLMKKSTYLEQIIERELAVAKKNGTKNKRAALQALKRKKRYEKQLQQIDGALSTIELQREALENSSANTEVLGVMSVAAKALKAVHDELDVDKVHELMDEIAEQHDIANEIDTAISNPANIGQDYDEDELLAELEELETEELTLKISGPIRDKLPSVPTADPSLSADTKEDDTGVLAAWAS